MDIVCPNCYHKHALTSDFVRSVKANAKICGNCGDEFFVNARRLAKELDRKAKTPAARTIDAPWEETE